MFSISQFEKDVLAEYQNNIFHEISGIFEKFAAPSVDEVVALSKEEQSELANNIIENAKLKIAQFLAVRKPESLKQGLAWCLFILKKMTENNFAADKNEIQLHKSQIYFSFYKLERQPQASEQLLKAAIDLFNDILKEDKRYFDKIENFLLSLKTTNPDAVIAYCTQIIEIEDTFEDFKKWAYTMRGDCYFDKAKTHPVKKEALKIFDSAETDYKKANHNLKISECLIQKGNIYRNNSIKTNGLETSMHKQVQSSFSFQNTKSTHFKDRRQQEKQEIEQISSIDTFLSTAKQASKQFQDKNGFKLAQKAEAQTIVDLNQHKRDREFFEFQRGKTTGMFKASDASNKKFKPNILSISAGPNGRKVSTRGF